MVTKTNIKIHGQYFADGFFLLKILKYWITLYGD